MTSDWWGGGVKRRK